MIVGSSWLSASFSENPASHAVMWMDGKVFDLQKLLAPQLPANITLVNASRITDSGKILVETLNAKTGATGHVELTPLITTHISIRSNINPSSYGQSIHLVATVKPVSGSAPQGNVQWYDNGVLLGTAGLTSLGTASWEPSTWAVGTHNVSVKFKGYTPDGPSVSGIFKQIANTTATKTTLLTPAAPVHGIAVTLTAAVVPSYGTIAGSVIFKSGSTTLGIATIDPRIRQAHLSTTFKTSGKFTLTAVYEGTASFKPSSSVPLTVTVK